MAISKDLFLALLSMDAYNRGYGAGVGGAIDGLGSSSDGSQSLGYATIAFNLNDAQIAPEAQAAGFYAVAYKTTKDIGAKETGGVIPKGTTLIAA